MPNNSDQIVVAPNGTLRVAPVGTAAPTNPTAAYAAGWVDLGFLTEAGAKFTDSKDVNEIRPWQSFYTVRRNVVSRDAMVEAALMQWSRLTIPLAFGGGTITTPSAGVFRYAPPAPEVLDYRQLGLDWTDGAKRYRLIMPKALVIDAVDTELNRGDAAILPVKFSLVADGVSDPWYILTDDPAWA